ncbi:MAG: VRR-NUC domain-containing protein [Trueperaceae bacterium]
MLTPESKVKAKVKAELLARGVWFFFPVANAFGKAGIPDVVGCWRGRFVAVECKAPGQLGRLTELQKLRIEEIEQAGGLACAVDGVELLKEKLDEWEQHLG